MALDASQVSAVVVTRGDVDLSPILDSLIYDECIVWDNSTKDRNYSVYGRYLAMAECKHDVIFFSDDDVLFTAHDELLAAYEPNRITCNMPSPWYENMQYDQLGMCLVGAGSLVPRDLPPRAFAAYLERWPMDDLFLDYCDFVSGMLSPGLRLDLGYEVLPHATAPGRINTTPGSHMRRGIMLNHVLNLRAEAA